MTPADLLARLPPAVGWRVERVAAVAERTGIDVYLVGGTVRDLLLGRESLDVDLVVDGDGLVLAAAVARELGGEVLEHAEFLTADVVDRDGFHLDIATARAEIYEAPAALPRVRPASLLEDLRRRDFTVNALAVRLGGGTRSRELIDPCNGLTDLAAGALRVLHSGSFVDDPTRALRGVRLEQRLGFRFLPETESLIDGAVAAGAFARLSGSRLLHELQLLLGDPAAAAPAVERLADLGLLAVLHPSLAESWNRAKRGGPAALGRSEAFGELLRGALAQHARYRQGGLAEQPVRLWLLVLMAIAAELDTAARAALAERLLLAGEERRLLAGFAERLAGARPALEAASLPHQADEALAALAVEELLLLAAGEPAAGRAWVWRYLAELRSFRLAIRGADLITAGVPAGPAVGRALASTRRARLDGEIGRHQELAFALGELGLAPPEGGEPAAAAGAGGSRQEAGKEPAP